MLSGRLIIERNLPGPINMAADGWLCRSCDAPLTLRLYDWQPWTLSLGFSQPWQGELRALCEEQGQAVVRRETGGRAVYHADELTYCVTIPSASPLHTDSLPESYERINRALRRGLQALGVDCGQEGRRLDMQAQYKKELGGLCFTASARSEVLWQGRKLVGSAQRQLREGLLQHGSLMLGPAHQEIGRFFYRDADRLQRSREKLAEGTCDLREILGQAPAWDRLCQHLVLGFEEEYGLSLKEQPFSDEERVQLRRLEPLYTAEKSSGAAQ